MIDIKNQEDIITIHAEYEKLTRYEKMKCLEDFTKWISKEMEKLK